MIWLLYGVDQVVLIFVGSYESFIWKKRPSLLYTNLSNVLCCLNWLDSYWSFNKHCLIDFKFFLGLSSIKFANWFFFYLVIIKYVSIIFTFNWYSVGKWSEQSTLGRTDHHLVKIWQLLSATKFLPKVFKHVQSSFVI